MKTNEYECAVCHGIFEKALTDEEARKQFEEEFPGMPFVEDGCDLVCDDCYQKMNEEIPTREWAIEGGKS